MTGEAIVGCHKLDFGPPGQRSICIDLAMQVWRNYPVIIATQHMYSMDVSVGVHRLYFNIYNTVCLYTHASACIACIYVH